MKYGNIIKAEFIERRNRFIAQVRLGNHVETVHVKNTGRCAELLTEGAEVWLTEPCTSGRKTRYDLVAVRKSNGVLFIIDSQAPNRVVGEWLIGQDFDLIRSEYHYRESRIDFYMERSERKYLMEVKGCTLERNGIGYFPDAPTERGVRHLHELSAAAREGFNASIAFVIQMDGVTEVRPNFDTHPAFGAALDEADNAGVNILFMCCHVEPCSLEITDVRRRPGLKYKEVLRIS